MQMIVLNRDLKCVLSPSPLETVTELLFRKQILPVSLQGALHCLVCSGKISRGDISISAKSLG